MLVAASVAYAADMENLYYHEGAPHSLDGKDYYYGSQRDVQDADMHSLDRSAHDDTQHYGKHIDETYWDTKERDDSPHQGKYMKENRYYEPQIAAMRPLHPRAYDDTPHQGKHYGDAPYYGKVYDDTYHEGKYYRDNNESENRYEQEQRSHFEREHGSHHQDGIVSDFDVYRRAVPEHGLADEWGVERAAAVPEHPSYDAALYDYNHRPYHYRAEERVQPAYHHERSYYYDQNLETEDNFNLQAYLADQKAQREEKEQAQAKEPAAPTTTPAPPKKIAAKPTTEEPAPAAPAAKSADISTQLPAADPSTPAAEPSQDEPAPEAAGDDKPTMSEEAKAFAEKAKTFIAEAQEDGSLQQFMEYCAKFGKSYIDQPEFKLRLYNWKRTEKFIQEQAWAARHYKVGHNKLSDWTQGEYEKLLGYAVPMEKKTKNLEEPESNATVVADSIDWRDYGMVDTVQNQGMCGSDWAFAANGAVEGAFGVQQGQFTELSVQQLLDCTGSATGCGGGTMTQAFDYLEKNYAMSAEAYPYNKHYAQRGECKYDEAKATTCMVDSYTNAESGDIEMMKKALTHQPIAAAINASSQSFMSYISGVYDDETCTSSAAEVNHAMLLIGYGSEAGEDYWLVQNTWGSDWGDSGYIRIAQKPGEGICGIQTSAVWVVLK